MLLDKEGIFSDNQTITSTCYSTNYIKMGTNDVSYVPIIVQVVTAFAGLTTLTVEFETSSTASFTTATSLGSTTVTLSKLTKGARFPMNYLPKGNLGYMRIKYTVVGTATAGQITAGIVAGHQQSWHD